MDAARVVKRRGAYVLEEEDNSDYLDVSICTFRNSNQKSSQNMRLWRLLIIGGSVYTGPVGTVPYGTDLNCLELFGTVPIASRLHGIGSKKF